MDGFLELLEFCVRDCVQWAKRMRLKTEWAGKRLKDFASITSFRERYYTSGRIFVLTWGEVTEMEF